MREKAILLSANLNHSNGFEQLMEELVNLVHACDMDVLEHVTQNIKAISAATYVGEGKVEEVRLYAEALRADVVVVNHELSPKQHRNLEKSLQIPVLDRTALILEIFRKRAKTREAKLQVELAEMKYLLPRLAGSYDALGRQGGGSGTYNKGTGEKKIELDRRKAEEKIHELSQALINIQNERTTQRKKRADSREKTIALVGYTNAGKSTLLNAFLSAENRSEDKHVFEKDMLFATLDTSVRRVQLTNKRRVLMSDTVGFVSHLPHDLVKAFGSTLEEVVDADLLLHVIDASNPDYESQMKVTLDTLSEIGANDIPMINVFNKADRLSRTIPESSAEGIFISAKNQIGLDLISDAVTSMLYGDELNYRLMIPYTEGSLIPVVNNYAFIKQMEHTAEGTVISASSDFGTFDRFKQYAFDAEDSIGIEEVIYEHPVDYHKVSMFLKSIYQRGAACTNWLEARWEYMHNHPILDTSIFDKIVLWKKDDEVVGMITPEMTFGDYNYSFNKDFAYIKSKMIQKAIELGGKRHFIPETDIALKFLLDSKGYEASYEYLEYRGSSRFQYELMPETLSLPDGYKCISLDEEYDLRKIDRVLWRGFDHDGEPDGDLSDREKMHSAPNFRKDLNFVVVAPNGEYASFSGCWYDPVTRAGYIEPVATDPDYRRMGLGKVAVLSCVKKCIALGAEEVYVVSGQKFYLDIGFELMFNILPWSKKNTSTEL